jgi:hypothetical protein
VALSWEFPGRWGQLLLPGVAGDDTDVLCAVVPGDSPAIVTAYERAACMAEQ